MLKNIKLTSAEPEIIAFFKSAQKSMTRLKHQAVVYGLTRSCSRCLLGVGAASLGWGFKNADTVVGKITAAAGVTAMVTSWALYHLERSAESNLSKSINDCIDNYDEFDYAARFKKDHPVEIYAQTITNAAKDFVGTPFLSTCTWYCLSQPSLGGKVLGGVFLLGTVFWGYGAIQNLKTAKRVTAEMRDSVTGYVKEKGYNIA